MTEWRNHPRLEGKFHPEFPDDIEVMIHDGGPRFSKKRPEVAWIRVTGLQGDVFIGTVLNAPHQLDSVSEGSTIRFIVPEGGQYPLMVSEKYLSERGNVIIHPCGKCGLTELFDAPSDLRKVVFPETNEDDIQVYFTAFCGACGGSLVIEDKEGMAQVKKLTKKWWEFWK